MKLKWKMKDIKTELKMMFKIVNEWINKSEYFHNSHLIVCTHEKF